MGSALPEPHAPPLSRGLGALALGLLAFGLWRAISLAWTCDDAFVSLRYAENLVLGHGLVYNPGEYVEGYTNLLWTLVLAAALALGAPAVGSSQALGIAAYLALALLLFAESRRRTREEGASFLPLAAGAVLVSPDLHQWASGGLETSLFTALALAGVLRSRALARSDRGAVATGALFSLLVLTRLDGALFAAAAAAGLLADGRRRAALRLLAPVALTIALWSAWKLAYYGELLPTAFYSKSVLRPYYGQGLVYLGLYLARNAWLPVALAAVAVWRWRAAGRASGDRDGAVLLGSALLYLAYVVHVGGDFMFGRRIVPAVPLLLVALERWLLGLEPARARAAFAAACIAAAALPLPLYDADTPRIRGVADERRFATERAIGLRRLQAGVVAGALADAPARVMFEGGMCAFGYYSRLPYQAEMSGLTQYSLAKLPLEHRGWIGHEKRATDDWLEQSDIHLILSHRFPPIPRPPGPPPIDLVYFGDVAVARIVRWDEDVMAALSEAEGVSFVPITEILKRRRREIERASPERAEEILAWLERFYLARAGPGAEAERASLRAAVAARGGSVGN
jgi:hypothetical protein